MSNLVSTSNHLKEYTEYLNYEKNFSKYTVKNYNIDINKFLNYLKTKEITKLNEINNETIQMYIISLNNDGLNPNSVSRIKSSVCSFIKFLYKHHVNYFLTFRRIDFAFWFCFICLF